MLSLHDQNRGPWILLHVALDKGRFNTTVCGRYTDLKAFERGCLS
jgi:hypothetical protein